MSSTVLILTSAATGAALAHAYGWAVSRHYRRKITRFQCELGAKTIHGLLLDHDLAVTRDERDKARADHDWLLGRLEQIDPCWAIDFMVDVA